MSQVSFKGRREDYRLVTGQGKYTSDWNHDGQLHAYFLRSDRAHAEILSLNVKPAREAPGVVAVFTGDDAAKAGFRTPPNLVKYPGKGGMQLKIPQRDVLAGSRVHHLGQEVALVVATSAAAAQDAAELIEIEYGDLPVVVDAEAALAPGAVQLHASIPGNLCFDFEYGDEGKTNEAFAKAAHITRLTLDAKRMVGNPMEPKACLVTYDDSADVYDIYVSSQGMSIMVGCLSGLTGLAPEKFRVHAQDVGGGFGIRSDAYPEYAALLMAARQLKRPVKWVSSRSETFLSDYHGRGAKLKGELALDEDGNFLAFRYEWIVNTGAFLSHAGPLINTAPPSSHAVNLYRVPVVYGRHRLAVTNTTPTTAYRGAGRPNVIYIVERLVDEAARELKLDRLELRRRNLLPKSAFPYKTPTGAVYDSGDPPGMLEAAIQQAQWSSFEARREAARKRGKLRGLGCAIFTEPSGGGNAPHEEAVIKFGESGNALIYALAGPSGQGHETVFPEIVGEVLGMAPEKFTLRASDPDGPRLVGEGTIGSRSVMSHGGAMVFAAREVIRKGLELAAKDLEVSAQDLEFEQGRYRVRGTDVSISLEDLAAKHAGGATHPLDSMGALDMPRSFPSGAHFAEVEIDRQTGVLDILTYIAVDDCGRIINHTLLEGQLQGGIIQGLGQVVGEVCEYDETGQMLTGTFMDYFMPRADMLPDIRLYDHSVPSPGNPLGAKGAGEAGTTGAVGAAANAVMDALRPLGIYELDFPYTPDRLWHAMHEAQGGRTN
jgi:carbon-monoxide dehydrogenase large subunit